MTEQRHAWALAVLSLAAGLLHASAIGAHEGQGQLPLLFAAAAAVQAGWALLVLARPSRMVLVAGAAINVGFFAFYVVTRLTGLPVEGLRTAENVGTKDLFTAAIELAIVGLVVVALVPNVLRIRRFPIGVAVGLGVAFTLVTVLALALGHGDAGHSHDSEAATGHDHHDESTADGATAEQQETADLLVAETAASLAQWEDVAVAEADGFVSIGDGRGSGYEHFINQENLLSSGTLDPEHPESLVYELSPDGTKTLASAMYILPPGSNTEDIPDVGGESTIWHDHDNLCWNDTGQIAGALVNGQCFPGGEHRGTSPPMLHVWVVDNPCGPFAGIESARGGTGHGESCEHAH